MNRSEWKQRLVDAEIPEEVVDNLLSTIKDDDLARMKDMSTEDILKAMKDALEESDDETETDESDDDAPETEDKDDDLDTKFDDLKDSILKQIVDQLNAIEIEVEAPQIKEMSDRVASLEESLSTLVTSMKDLQDSWAEVLRGDGERLKDMMDNMSPAQRVRLRATLTGEAMDNRIKKHLKDRKIETTEEPKSDFHQLGQLPLAKPGDVVIQDAEGNKYATLGDMARGNPI